MEIAHHSFLKNLAKETNIGHWPVILHVILIESGFFSIDGRHGKTWSVKGSNLQRAIKLIYNVIRMLWQSFTKLVDE